MTPSLSQSGSTLHPYSADFEAAYEHLLGIGPYPVAGDSSRLQAILEGRVVSVLGLRPAPRGPNSDPDWLSGFRAWVSAGLAEQSGGILSGDISDIEIAANEEVPLSDEWPRLQEEFNRDMGKDGVLRDSGFDAYAMYLPIHFHYCVDGSRSHWGIYVGEQGVMRLAAALRAGCMDLLGSPTGSSPNLGFVRIAYQILLRHELEHFKFEAFALNAELTAQRALYLPYFQDVYAKSFPTKYCFEEALANAGVLSSTAVGAIFGKELYPSTGGARTNWQWKRVAKQRVMDLQPEAYANYRLIRGWPKNRRTPYESASGKDRLRLATNRLANQIIAGCLDPQPAVPFYAFAPANFFPRLETLVPVHVVRSPTHSSSCFRFQPPKETEWMKFLRVLGYRQTLRGKGDHTVVRTPYGWPDMTINTNGKELDYNSFKSGLRNLGIPANDFWHFKRTGQLPPSLARQVDEYNLAARQADAI